MIPIHSRNNEKGLPDMKASTYQVAVGLVDAKIKNRLVWLDVKQVIFVKKQEMESHQDSDIILIKLQKELRFSASVSFFRNSEVMTAMKV